MIASDQLASDIIDQEVDVLKHLLQVLRGGDRILSPAMFGFQPCVGFRLLHSRIARMSPNETSISLSMQGRSISLTYPKDLDDEIWPFFGHLVDDAARNRIVAFRLHPTEDGKLAFEADGHLIWTGLVWPNLLHTLVDEIERAFASGLPDVILRAGAVRAPAGISGRSILIVGPPGCHKTELTAWLTDRGFFYLADNFTGLHTDHSNLRGERDVIGPLALPLAAHVAIEDGILGLAAFNEAYGVAAGGRVYMRPGFEGDTQSIEHCGLVIVPQFHEGADLAIDPLRPDELRFLLRLALHPDQALTSARQDRIASFSQTVPAIMVRFGDHSQLTGALDDFACNVLESNLDIGGLGQFLEKWNMARAVDKTCAQAADTKIGRAPLVTPTLARYPKRLTVGMATFDDYDGVYFTLQSIRLHHPEVADEIEYIVVDNNPDGVCGHHLKALENWIPTYRYIPVRERSGTAVRDYVMQEAASDYVLNLDCHVLLVPGSLARLMRYFEVNPQTSDLLQGPMLYDGLNTLSTHMKPEWWQGTFGTWGRDEAGCDPEAPPFDIPLQGLGLYACRRAAWPGYNPMFRGFGGEEGYIHEKFRQAGGRTLCLPFLRWLHRFGRPLGVPYKVSWHDRVRNYLIGFEELGWSTEPVLAHFRDHIGSTAETVIEDIQREITSLKSGSLR